MSDIRTQQISLVGQVVEDVTFAPLRSREFVAELIGLTRSPLYKEGGFFVFTNVRQGLYTLRIAAERFQPQEYLVSIPLHQFAALSPPSLAVVPLFSSPGDNELVVSVSASNNTTRKITFDPVILTRAIPAGVPVEGPGFSTTLAGRLDVGRVTEAKLTSVGGLSAPAIVRIVRDRSIRLNFDPYYLFPLAITRIVGRVVRLDAWDVPLAGVRIELSKINGANVVLNPVGDAQIATVTIAGSPTVLGAERDITTVTNQNGDYNFYFARGAVAGNVTVVATLPGFQPQTAIGFAVANQRQRLDFQLTPL